MTSWRLKTPVVLIIFNRLETTERVFHEIAKARPPKLLVIADGPRSDHPGESEKCAKTRAVLKQVDWECEVITNYSEVNMGCRKRVSSGIDWVFEQVPEAIILEDDCLPHQSFFRYCEELLEYYRYDTRIMAISGDNFQFGQNRGGYSYYYSRNNHVWGWASWRRAWQHYDVDMTLWPAIRDSKGLKKVIEYSKERKYWEKNFEKVYQGSIDTWDFQWVFACRIKNGLVVLPQENLVSNIGFGKEATHTVGRSDLAEMGIHEMTFPLSHPDFIQVHQEADRYTFEKIFYQPIWKKLRKLKIY